MKGLEDCYEVSPFGNVRSKERTIIDSIGRRVTKYPRDMSRYVKPDGFTAVSLSREGQKYSRYVHRLIAECYVINPDPSTHIFVRFKDGNKENIRWDNLEWTKQSTNADYVIYKDNLNRKYGYKVNNEILDDLLAGVLYKGMTVNEAATQIGYSNGYMSVVLRRRAAQRDLMDVWKATVSVGHHAKSSE